MFRPAPLFTPRQGTTAVDAQHATPQEPTAPAGGGGAGKTWLFGKMALAPPGPAYPQPGAAARLPEARGHNSKHPPVPGPFSPAYKGTLPKGEVELERFMAQRGDDQIGEKLAKELAPQIALYKGHCKMLRVEPFPININALLLHVEQKCAENGAATTARNWASGIVAHARRNRLGDLSAADRQRLSDGLARLEKKFGVYNEDTPALAWQQLAAAARGTRVGESAAEGGGAPPLGLRLRTTLTQAALAQACGLRPGEHTGSKCVIKVADVEFLPRSDDLPRGALKLTLTNRKAAKATGADKGIGKPVWAEPPCDELDFVAQLNDYVERNGLREWPSEPLFASMDKFGNRKLLGGALRGPGATQIAAPEYNANLKELLARAGITDCTARSTRAGFASDLAAKGVNPLVIQRRMDHAGGKRKRGQSTTTVYVKDGLPLLRASRGDKRRPFELTGPEGDK